MSRQAVGGPIRCQSHANSKEEKGARWSGCQSGFQTLSDGKDQKKPQWERCQSPEKKGIAQATSVVATTYRLLSTILTGHLGPALKARHLAARASSAIWNTGWENTWYAGTWGGGRCRHDVGG